MFNRNYPLLAVIDRGLWQTEVTICEPYRLVQK